MGWNSSYWENGYWNADWWFDGIDYLAVAAQAEEEKKIFNAAKARRAKHRMISTRPTAPIEQPPIGPTAPIAQPNAELVARIAAQFRNVRGRAPRGGGFGGGTNL